MNTSIINYVRDYKTAYLLPYYNKNGKLRLEGTLVFACRERYLDYYASNKRVKDKVILLTAPKPKWGRLLEEFKKLGMTTLPAKISESPEEFVFKSQDLNLKYYPVRSDADLNAPQIWVSEINIPKRFSYNIIGMYLFLYLVRQTLSYNRRPEPEYEMLLTCYLKYHKVWFRRSKFLTDAEYTEMLTYNKGPISVLRGRMTKKGDCILFERMIKTLPDDVVVRQSIVFFNKNLPEGFRRDRTLLGLNCPEGGIVGYNAPIELLRNLIISKNKKGFHLIPHLPSRFLYFAKP